MDSRALNLVVVPNEVAEDDGYALHAGVVEQHVTPDVCEPLFKVAQSKRIAMRKRRSWAPCSKNCW